MMSSVPKGAKAFQGILMQRHTGAREELRPLFELAEDSPTQLDSYLHEGDVIVAVCAGQVVAHLQLTEAGDGGEIEIKNLAVLASHRRRGIGRALIAAAIDEACERGRSMLCVATAAADTDNLRFYQRAGFRMRSVERDAFTAAGGYDANAVVDGIPLRDRVWLDLPLGCSSA